MNIPALMKRWTTRSCLAFILGLTSVGGQILLIRELITVFYGNETAYAVILASWLFGISAGSFSASRWAPRLKDPRHLIALLEAVTAFLLPASLLAARSLKFLLGIGTGEIVGILPMCRASFVLLLPLTFVLGCLFTFLCRWADKPGAEAVKAQSAGRVYLWESVGAAAGGLILSCVLIPFLPAFLLAVLWGAVNLVAALFLTFKKDVFHRSVCVLGVVMIILVAAGVLERLDGFFRDVQWKGQDVVVTTDSIYGNITLIQQEEGYSLYESGLLSFTTRDDLSSEESVHYALLEHPQPQRVLLIGNGVAGSLREILKYEQVSVDYVELDPKIIRVSQTFLPHKAIASLEDPRVRILYADARLCVKSSKERYDVIIVNLPDPYTALLNRYYSQEFFREAQEILEPDGVISFSVVSSENYLNEETRAFLRSLNTTLKSVFPETVSIPGDTHIFLACNRKGVLTRDADKLIDRLRQRGIPTDYVSDSYLPFRLSEDRIAYIEDVLKQEGRLNTDMRPIAYLFDIVLWSTHFHTGFKNFIERIEGLRLWHLMLIPFMVLLLGAGLKRRRPAFPVTLSIMTTGFSEIIFQIIVVLAFQTLYGYAYYKVGFIIASFMAGLVGGTVMAQRLLRRTPEEILKIYKIVQAGITVYPLLLPLVFVIFRDTVTRGAYAGFFAGTFAVLPVVAGFMGGVQYPCATYLLTVFSKRKEEDISGPAGFLYAADVMGATLGALLTGTILIPLLGISAVAFFCAALNAVVWLLLLGLSGKKG